jgi:hypothetical protein
VAAYTINGVPDIPRIRLGLACIRRRYIRAGCLVCVLIVLPACVRLRDSVPLYLFLVRVADFECMVLVLVP